MDEATGILRIAACSYEGSLFGWALNEHSIEDDAKEDLKSTLTFGFNCCESSLKAIAISQSGKYLAAAGMDERIRIFNISQNKSVGEVATHSGAITSLSFFNDSFLLSASEVCNYYNFIFIFFI
jgi:WD40 repeat protein